MLRVLLRFLGYRIGHYFWQHYAWKESTVLALERKVAEQPDNPLWPLELGRIYDFRRGHADGSAYRANGVLAVKHYEAWRKRCEPASPVSTSSPSSG